jgi:hypothetical protein
VAEKRACAGASSLSDAALQKRVKPYRLDPFSRLASSPFSTQRRPVSLPPKLHAYAAHRPARMTLLPGADKVAEGLV